MSSLLEVKNCSKEFVVERGLFGRSRKLQAVQNVSFSIHPGEIVALVGESGSGKSTIGKMIQGLLEPTEGHIFFDGRDAKEMNHQEKAHWTQMIFQDPFASLNPKLSVGTILREALQSYVHLKKETGGVKISSQSIENLLKSVGLPPHIMNDYPHQFSGGQRQRLVIARALAMQPKLIIADEPVSALDLSIQAQILNLLTDLNQTLNVAYLLITHDLAIVEQLADRVLVIENGLIVEEGTTESIFSQPKEDYTKRLFSAVLSVV